MQNNKANLSYPHIAGFALEPFTELKETFLENFKLGFETAGASFAVYHNNQLVVDVYGGYSNREEKKLWNDDTRAIIFSITKGLSALVLAMLIDQGHASYDDYVCKYWPKFGNCGKEYITIRQVVNHQAGLVYGNQTFTIEDVQDANKMSAKFENMHPVWTPGIHCGYHTLTFGFLIDQIVRRIDRQERGVVEYLKEEVIDKYGLKDISIGLQKDEDNVRVAPIYESTEEELQEERKRNPEALRKFALCDNEHLKRVYENWPWVKIPDYNKLQIRRLKMPSNMGIGTARSLAQLHYLIIHGDLLSKVILEQISQPQLVNEMDIINCYPESKGFGWQYFQNPLGQWIFGHSGYGGQNMRVDIHKDVSYVYLCNGLKAADADDVDSFARLQNKLYKCLEKLK